MQIRRADVEVMIIVIQSLDRPIVISEESEETTGADGKVKKTVKKSERMLAFDVPVRIALGQTVRRLRNELESIKEDSQALFKQRSTPEALVTETTEKGEASKLVGQAGIDFRNDINELMSTKVEIDFVQIKVADLEMKKNPVPIECIGYLWDRVFVD